MAANRFRITIDWENNVQFKVEAQRMLPVQEPPFTIVRVDENEHLLDIWSSAVDIMERFIKAKMEDIRKDMAVP